MSFATYCWLAFVGYWIISARAIKPIQEHEGFGGRLALLGIPTLVGFVLADVFSSHFGGRWASCRYWADTFAIHLLGNGVVLLGLVIAIWARRTLGGNWSASITFKEGHELIERGPYRFVRHPIYTGILSLILGSAIVSGRGPWFLGLALYLIAAWIKLRQEETMMTKHFPEAYPAYKSRTKALIPFLL